MAVDARTLAGTRWQVTAINRHPTSLTDRYRMSFETSRNFSVRFGCNSGGGHYRVTGSSLAPVGPVIATQMACAPMTAGPDPMTFEHWGFAVASHAMSMHWVDGRHLILSNASGSIELERLPPGP